MSKLIVTRMPIREVLCDVAALYENGKMSEIRIQKTKAPSLLGNIYVGQVENIAENIQAAFVMIDKNQRCYLPLAEVKHPVMVTPSKRREIRAGDQLLVQVSREAMKAKLPSVQTNLNFTGQYLVLTTGDHSIGFSKKIGKAEKERLQKILEGFSEIQEETRPFGVIVRTNAAGISTEELKKEFELLREQWKGVVLHGVHRTCFSCLYHTHPSYVEAVRDVYRSELEEIVTDSMEMYEEISEFLLQTAPEDHARLRFYEDKLLALSKLYSMEKQLGDALNEKIWMKSGGFLVIQQTEAFVAVDVNTGKYEGKKKAEETYRKINLEAAEEIARQIRLRNLSGIILIDFINMENPDHEEELFHVLKKHMRKDPVKGKVIDITPLHILEMTRKKVRKTLLEEVESL